MLRQVLVGLVPNCDGTKQILHAGHRRYKAFLQLPLMGRRRKQIVFRRGLFTCGDNNQF